MSLRRVVLFVTDEQYQQLQPILANMRAHQGSRIDPEDYVREHVLCVLKHNAGAWVTIRDISRKTQNVTKEQRLFFLNKMTEEGTIEYRVDRDHVGAPRHLYRFRQPANSVI